MGKGCGDEGRVWAWCNHGGGSQRGGCGHKRSQIRTYKSYNMVRAKRTTYIVSVICNRHTDKRVIITPQPVHIIKGNRWGIRVIILIPPLHVDDLKGKWTVAGQSLAFGCQACADVKERFALHCQGAPPTGVGVEGGGGVILLNPPPKACVGTGGGGAKG